MGASRGSAWALVAVCSLAIWKDDASFLSEHSSVLRAFLALSWRSNEIMRWTGLASLEVDRNDWKLTCETPPSTRIGYSR